MESSRIFIRGLPPDARSGELQQHFSSVSPVTDVKYIPHRRIAYVGYRDPAEAAKAIKYYNKSFLRMSRVFVEPARSVEEQREKTATQNAEMSGISRRNVSSLQDVAASQNAWVGKRKADDIQLDNSSKGRHRNLRTNVGAEEKDDARYLADRDIASPRDLDIQGAGLELQRAAVKDDGTKDANAIHVTSAPDSSNDSSMQSGSNKRAASDADWLRSRTSRLLGLIDDDELTTLKAPAKDGDESHARSPSLAQTVSNSTTETQNQACPAVFSNQEHSANMKNAAKMNSGRLFLRNLAYDTKEEDLRELFNPYDDGSLIEVHVAQNFRTGSGKGYAYIEFANPETAEETLRKLDGTSFRGRLLHIMPAENKRHIGLDEFAISKLPLKKQNQIKRRAEAATSNFNWNALFMNADAVMSSVSERLGVPKSEMLDPTSSDAAVKQAHAETHIIQETKEYFLANGVDLNAFKRKDRGDSAILVKNFSYQTKPSELKDLFENYGPLLKILVPPAGTIAIAEFQYADHARAAFTGLAYRKLKDSILFLEKAPKDLFRETKPRVGNDETSASLGVDSPSDPVLNQPVDSSTLFVRNLNFSTTTDRLREVFRPLEGFLSARVKTKPNPKKQGQALSMGFGFLEFQTKIQAQAALTAMDGYRLDGHQLLIRASHQTIDAAEERRKEDSAKKALGRRTKIIIKNLPFEASKKEVRSLFSPYGQLRSVRVPKKFDLSTRGFAFAEFITAREAESAINALKDTHLLGRRLVLEFATEDAVNPEEEIAKMQHKVGKQADKVALQNLAGSGRKKFNVEDREAADY